MSVPYMPHMSSVGDLGVTERPKRLSFDYWETTSVTALPPGWVNQHKQDDGTVDECACPALLLQELRTTVRSEDGNEVEEIHEPPYRTRVVFADLDDFGGLDDAAAVSNYIATVYRSPS